MYCPTCGAEQRGQERYCRGCGAELQPVRMAMERPDTVTNAAVTAREEIGRAIALKIQEIDDARDLRRVVEDVLPAINKFLESPEESRLRRIREGITTASTGIGIALFGLALSLLAPSTEQISLIVIGAAAIVFLIGLGLAANGLFFTAPKKRALPAGPQSIRELPPVQRANTSPSMDSRTVPPSVTEATTYELKPIDRTTGPR